MKKYISCLLILTFACCASVLRAQEKEDLTLTRLETKYTEIADLSVGDPFKADTLAFEILDEAAENNYTDLHIRTLILISKIKLLKGRNIRSLRFAEKALDLAENKGSKKQVGSSLLNLAVMFTEVGNLDKARDLETQAFELFQELEDDKGMLEALTGLIDSYTTTGEVEKVLPLIFKALESAKSQQNKSFEARLLGNIGMAYGYMQELDKAKEYLSKSEAIFVDLDDKRGLARIYNDMGTVGFFSADTAYAAKYYNKALTINKEINDIRKIMLNYGNLTALYGQMGDMKRAKYYLNESRKVIPDSSQTIPARVHRLSNLAGILTIEGNTDEALAVLEEILPLARKSDLKRVLKDAHYNLSTIYEGKGDHQKAFNAFRTYVAYKDSLESEKTKNDLHLAEARFTIGQNELELENQEQALKLSEQKQDISRLQVKQRNAWITAISISALLIITIIVFVLWRQKVAKAQQESEFKRKKSDLEQRVLRASMNPHFIFNALNSIQGLYMEGDNTRADDYLADFGSLLRRTLDNSLKEKISIKEELETLILYIDLEKTRSETLFDYKIEIEPELLDSGVQVPPFVLQPFVENAIWHGILPKNSPGHLSIKVTDVDTHLRCEVKDDGVGFKETHQVGHTSQGIQTTRARLGASGNVEINKNPEGGTIVTLNIPIS